MEIANLSEDVRATLLARIESDEYLADRLKIMREDGGDEDLVLLEVAADAGMDDARVIFGRLLCEGDGVQMDIARGITYMLQAAGNGHPDAITEMTKIAQDMQNRIDELQKAGNLDAETGKTLLALFKQLL